MHYISISDDIKLLPLKRFKKNLKLILLEKSRNSSSLPLFFYSDISSFLDLVCMTLNERVFVCVGACVDLIIWLPTEISKSFCTHTASLLSPLTTALRICTDPSSTSALSPPPLHNYNILSSRIASHQTSIMALFLDSFNYKNKEEYIFLPSCKLER